MLDCLSIRYWLTILPRAEDQMCLRASERLPDSLAVPDKEDLFSPPLSGESCRNPFPTLYAVSRYLLARWLTVVLPDKSLTLVAAAQHSLVAALFPAQNRDIFLLRR